jgi:hypothetical protein
MLLGPRKSEEQLQVYGTEGEVAERVVAHGSVVT